MDGLANVEAHVSEVFRTEVDELKPGHWVLLLEDAEELVPVAGEERSHGERIAKGVIVIPDGHDRVDGRQVGGAGVIPVCAALQLGVRQQPDLEAVAKRSQVGRTIADAARQRARSHKGGAQASGHNVAARIQSEGCPIEFYRIVVVLQGTQVAVRHR
eukprot:scaffold18271_cov71-Phaeocystis_antarctica.AAC.2